MNLQGLLHVCFGPNASNCSHYGVGIFVRNHVIAIYDDCLLAAPRETRKTWLQYLHPCLSEFIEIFVPGISRLTGSEHYQRKVSEIACRTHLGRAISSENGVLSKNRRQVIRS